MIHKRRYFRFLIGLTLKKFFPFVIKRKAVYSRLSFTKDTETLVEDKNLFFHCHNEEISNSIFYTGIFGDYEGQTIKMWYQICKNLSLNTALDVGAFTGFFSFVAASANPKIEIHAYEPNPVTFKILQKNLDLNNCDNVTINNFGLSNKNGHEKFFNFGGGVNPGMTSVDHQYVNTNLSHSLFEIRDILEIKKILNKKIDLIKLDIERAELEILHRAKDIIDYDKPIIFCEILDIEMYDSFQDFFQDLTYEYIQIDDEKKQYYFTPRISNNQNIGRNWIFYPKELKDQLSSIFLND